MITVKIRHFMSATAMVLAAAAAASAQTSRVEDDVFVSRNVDIQMIGGAGAPDIQFMAAPIAFDSETVTGAPYTAEAITEVVQPLADGNRIVRQTRAELARDNAGRTRREQGLAMLGPMINVPEEFRHVQITDPETHTIILLDTKNKTAEKMRAPTIRVSTNPVGTAVKVTTGKPPFAGVEAFAGSFEAALPAPLPAPGDLGQVKMLYHAEMSGPMPRAATESLGKQLMEGVQAEGTRTTFTIPAGQIGNELPINVTSERWYSPELKVLVMSHQFDPRFGDTTYRLTNVVRGEPSASLFEVPADFTVNRER